MLAKDIKVGATYRAKVSGRETDVVVLNIRKVNGVGKSIVRYDVKNLKTNRETSFRSAAKFRSEVGPKPQFSSEELLRLARPHLFEQSAGAICRCSQLASAVIHDVKGNS